MVRFKRIHPLPSTNHQSIFPANCSSNLFPNIHHGGRLPTSWDGQFPWGIFIYYLSSHEVWSNNLILWTSVYSLEKIWRWSPAHVIEAITSKKYCIKKFLQKEKFLHQQHQVWTALMALSLFSLLLVLLKTQCHLYCEPFLQRCRHRNIFVFDGKTL